MNGYKLERIALSNLNESEFNNIPGKSVFTTIPWLLFVSRDSKVEDYILRVSREDGQFCGYFTGFLTKKLGVKILGSPFAGWSTCYMGLELLDRTHQFDILREVVKHAYTVDRVLYVEIIDRNISATEATAEGIYAQSVGTLQLDIGMDDADLFKQMKTDCRNFIRQFERRGASIEITEPDSSFAEDYYRQLIDVFSKQGMVPTYSLEKVKCLLDSLKNTGELLCLRVRNPDGAPIATSIFIGYNSTFFFWGGASYRSEQHYRPNEYMIWTAIQYWREKGYKVFDMMGIRDYKRKFGSHEEYYAQMIFSRIPFLITGRNAAKAAYFMMLKIKGKVLHKE